MKPNQGIKRVSLVVVVLAGMGVASVAVADPEATARRHAAKANQLAAKNKCKSALPWFNRAYRTLKDPTLLFNRAECLRKIGENDAAILDYELFLSEIPKTPNRAAVEARIASLREASSSAPIGTTVPDTAKEAPVAAAKGPSPAAKPPASPSKESPFAAGKEAAPAAPVKDLAPAAAKPAEKAAAEPARRAEKWTD